MCDMSAMMPKGSSSGPSDGKVVRVLRDGYWDRTEVIRLADGSLRVRKTSKGSGASGPWAQGSLRREIEYLKGLEREVVGQFPALLCAWDDGGSMGYEMSYVGDAVAASESACSGRLGQGHADRFQARLGEVVFGLVHTVVTPGQVLSRHVRDVISTALAELGRMSEFSSLINAAVVRINGHELAGPGRAMAGLFESEGSLSRLDRGPQVRLHGDCFLENILVPRRYQDVTWPTGLMLIDPVSVAGVYQGHPLFDLVKYESYATGELPALRSENIDVDGFDEDSDSSYVYQPRLDEPTLRPFKQVDWCGGLRAAYVAKYGDIDCSVYHLLDGYFALAMAMCTDGRQRRGRVLKGTIAMNAALASQDC